MQRSPIERRTYLKGVLGATVLAGGVPAAAGGEMPGTLREDEDDDEKPEDREHPAARPILCDVSAPMGFETVMHYDGDPADSSGSRDRVVHVTSEGRQTSDYAAGLVNVRKRSRGPPVTLGGVETLTYDYFQGPQHTTAAPDEVFLVLQTKEQRERNEGVALFKTIDDGRDAPGSLGEGRWRAVDVRREMRSGDWRAIEISEDPAEMRVSDDETIGQAVERTAANLRDQEATFSNVVGRYGSDAELVGVGFGVGSTRTPSTVDIYYDDLVLDVEGPGQGQGQGQGRGQGGDGGRGDGGPQGDGPPGQQRQHQFDFPVVFPMDLSFDSAGGSGEVSARLEPVQNEVGVNLGHLIGDSVTLFGYSEAAPPLEEGVTPSGRGASVSDGGIDATFDVSEIGSLPTLSGSGDQFVLVAGEFDFEHVVWFLAEGTVSL